MIKISQENITELKVDAIVNAANSQLARGAGVCGAIFNAAGFELDDYCKNLNGCKTGEAVITPGFNLHAKFIIHTVGPVWNGGNNNEATLLENCYQNSLNLAKENNIKTIAFPAISTGIFGYPIDQATHIALSIMIKNQDDFDEIIACCFSESDFNIYNKIFNELNT